MAEMTYIDTLIANAKKAQKEFESYTQEQVDELVRAMGKVIYDNAEELAREAVEETGYGRVDSKIIKLRKSSMAAWFYMKGKKSTGILEYDTMNDLVLIAKPLGVVAALVPTTNPTSTMASNGMSIIKCKNACIISPHPRAKKCTMHGFQLIRDELDRLGAPKNIFQIVEELSVENTDELMKKSDVIVATGGTGMVKAAYSSGRPSFGVGPGNDQVVVAPDYTDYDFIAKTVVGSRSYDNGMACVGEQALHVQKDRMDDVVSAFLANDAAMIPDDKLPKLQEMLFKPNGSVDAAHVGMTALEIADYLGITVPESTQLLIFKCPGMTRDNWLRREKMCPLVQFFPYDTFNDALANAKSNLEWEGAGHTSIVYTNDKQAAEQVGVTLPVSRVLVNMPGNAASGGNFINGLAPTMSLGCGSWGNNSISENLTYRHMMNVTRLAYYHDSTMPEPEKVWGE